MKSLLLGLASFLALGVGVTSGGDAAPRPIPQPLANHPGNVFVAGETVRCAAPQSQSEGWRVLDYDDQIVASLRPVNGEFNLGSLPVGFYRLVREGESNWISFAVLAPLKAPTPLSSPVALDVAMAWFYPKEKMDAAANLCALAGVNWVRDRLAWGQMEPKRGRWAEPNRYDQSASAQSRAGLRVLQVNHSSPSWANPSGKRFPLDLLDTFRFHREMARRWRGQVPAFEPWNEADIPMFGGHTGSEMASLQKAAYLGLKAGNPDVIAGLNVFASHNRAQLDDLHDNEAWPYFDTFNLHHYAPFEQYPRLYAEFRSVSAGRPLWVSECALPVKWAGDEKLKEPTVADSRLLSERVVKVFALSLYEGSVTTFYFMLPHYVEGQTQFGVLRPDLTPRPGYVALAAVGRLLADAKPKGRVKCQEPIQALLFHAQPDGQRSDMLVAWATKGTASLDLPAKPAAVFDHLGRSLKSSASLSLSTAPQFVVLPAGSAERFALEPPPTAPPRLPGAPSPVALQALWPPEKVILKDSAYRLSSEKAESVPLFVYNFGDVPVSGLLRVTAPDGWKTSSFDTVDIPAHSRRELRLKLDGRTAASPKSNETVRVRGDFGPAGQPVLSMRVLTHYGMTKGL
ncbi:MAG: hypothetical protein HZA90_17645 [Verrucomicrobia bacterium]|nr:hypothetical protein [Verrucomicrobiota bacterium]